MLCPQSPVDLIQCFNFDKLDHAPTIENLSSPTNMEYKSTLSDHGVQPLSIPNLQEHYMSSEEDESPNPDSDVDSRSNFDDCMNSADFLTSGPVDEFDFLLYDEVDELEPEIATVVQFHFVGRPRMVDVSALAPMQKRKRSPTVRRPNTPARSRAHSLRTPLVSARIEEEVREQALAESARELHTLLLASQSWLADDQAGSLKSPCGTVVEDALKSNDVDSDVLGACNLPVRTASLQKVPGSVSRARKHINQWDSKVPAGPDWNPIRPMSRHVRVPSLVQVPKRPRSATRVAENCHTPMVASMPVLHSFFSPS